MKKRYERVKDYTLTEWVYFFAGVTLKNMPMDAKNRAEYAIFFILNDRYRTIFLKRYKNKLMLEAIAQEEGISKPRIYSILKSSITKLGDSEVVTVILRDGIEKGKLFQKRKNEENLLFFSNELIELLKNDTLIVNNLVEKNYKKNVAIRLQKEFGNMTVGELVVISKKKVNTYYGIGAQSQKYLKKIFQEYAMEKIKNEPDDYK